MWCPLKLKTIKYPLTVFALLALSLFLGRHPGLAAEVPPKVLLRVDIEDDSQLASFEGFDIPIYAQLWDERGGMYLLADVDAEQRSRLDRAGFSSSILDADSRAAVYYLVYTPHPVDQSQILESDGVILVSTSRYLLVRFQSSDIPGLPVFPFKMQRLTPYHLSIRAGETAAGFSAAITPDPAVQVMMEAVSTSTAHDYVGDLSGEWPITVNGNPYTILTRYSYDEIPIKKATKFVFEHFTALGLVVDFDDYTLKGVPLRHVIAEQPGSSNPECIVLIVGHLDDTVGGSSLYNLPSYAPGADDNASGSAGVLISADVLHQHQFACTIRYILFTGEEQIADPDIYTFASSEYVQQIHNDGDNVIAVINLDMIGYNSDQYERIELHTRYNNSGDLAIANVFKNVIQAYGINLTPQIVQDNLSWSDHKSFWDYGYSAVLAMEDWEDFTPFYHSTGDQLGTLDVGYMRDFIRAAVGSVAHLAGYIPPQPEPAAVLFFPLLLRSE
jgi:hypothetical protein